MNYPEEKTHHDFFSKEEGKRIIDAIRDAEQETSGEIRVHIEDVCDGEPLDRAIEVFEKLQMDRTAGRNGVLIYIAVKSRKFAIYGDEALNELVPDDFWNEEIAAMKTDFRAGRFVHGVKQAIEDVGEKLKQFFPWHKEVSNELPDDVSYGKDFSENE